MKINGFLYVVLTIPLSSATLLNETATPKELEQKIRALEIENNYLKQENLQCRRDTEARVLTSGTAALNGCREQCDLNFHDWVFILGTGRSGSTTLLQMINLLPNIELSGEHDGELLSFYDLRDRLRLSRRRVDFAPFFNPADQSDDELYCLVQRWYFLHTGKSCAAQITHGFKEIRYTSSQMFDFIKAVFPSSKIIFNVRLHLEQQAQSNFNQRSPDTEKLIQKLNETNHLMIEWAGRNPEFARVLSLEQFNPGNFTDLFKWLGHEECTAKRVFHTNKQGEYSSMSEIDFSEAVRCGKRA